MQVVLGADWQDQAQGKEAASILHNCVHCGFCLPACPTYAVTGNELDSPRGRIYLLKQLFEGQPVSAASQYHLDRCLGCRACESACPAGVRYHRLLDIGRHTLEARDLRRPWVKLRRKLVLGWLNHPAGFTASVRAGHLLRPIFPRLAASIPRPGNLTPAAFPAQAERWLLLEGCVQATLAPHQHAASERVLAACGIQLERISACCGAMAWHSNQVERARTQMQHLMQQCEIAFNNGAQGLVSNASGCASQLQEYGSIFADDTERPQAQKLSHASVDICELVARHVDRLLPKLKPPADPRLALHLPCSLQHSLHLGHTLRALLQKLGYILLPVADAHLCCGSAGTYSLLQPRLAKRLRDDCLNRLEAGLPTQIATANLGCQCHLQAGTALPVRHWIELIDDRLHETPTLNAHD